MIDVVQLYLDFTCLLDDLEQLDDTKEYLSMLAVMKADIEERQKTCIDTNMREGIKNGLG